MKSVRSRSSALSSARIACRMRRVEDVERLDAERAPEHLRREARAAHPEQDESSKRSIAASREGLDSTDVRIRSGSSSQPSHFASSCPSRRSGRAPRSARTRSSMSITRYAETSSPRFFATPSSSSLNESANFCTPSSSSVSDDVVVVDAGLRELARAAASPRRAPRRDVVRDLAVILERLDRLDRHRVHGVRPDQLLDVHHVAVVRVLRRGRGPEAALRRRALRGERLPALAGEDLACSW